MIELHIALSDEHYQYLQQRAQKLGTSLDRVVSELIESELAEQQVQAEDMLLDMIGAYHSAYPLIDNIPPSEDPDLYLIAQTLGERAQGMHAWELAPQRYRQGANGEALRRTDQIDS